MSYLQVVGGEYLTLTIQAKKGIIGIVKNVYENSVIIKILENPTDVF